MNRKAFAVGLPFVVAGAVCVLHSFATSSPLVYAPFSLLSTARLAPSIFQERPSPTVSGNDNRSRVSARFAKTSVAKVVTRVPQTFEVNSTADDVDTGGCQVFSTSTDCTLREAITAANANVGADTINFEIPGAGARTITLGSALPVITDSVTIDGTSQTGARANTSASGALNATLLIEIVGSTAFNSDAITLRADNSVIRGLAIRKAESDAIAIEGNNNRVESCFIGTDAIGAGFERNNVGVRVLGNDNFIGGTTAGARNLISNNFNAGVSIGDINNAAVTPTGNNIQGNLIGTDKSSIGLLPNVNSGITIIGNAVNNTIGGTIAAARNIISGNDGTGISVSTVGSTQNINGTVIQGNIIGLDSTGKVIVANGDGIRFFGRVNNSTIGGATAAARNIISGNDGTAIQLNSNSDGAPSGNIIRGNFIGTDINGTQDVGNDSDGIALFGATNTIIGGANAGEGNRIGGNFRGIVLSAGGSNVVQGNTIGGSAALSNGAGIEIVGSSNNIIGLRLDGTGAGNTISFGNASVGNGIGIGGIALFTSNGPAVRNIIRGNSIFSNSGIGIDFGPTTPGGPDGPTANDETTAPFDTDSGGNNLQNKPVLTSIINGDTITGTLKSTPSEDFILDFYSNTAADASVFGQGQTLIFTQRVTTLASGIRTFSFDTNATINGFVTATATRVATGDTSEFSNRVRSAQILEVNSTADDIDGGGCQATPGDCTLREAITDSNRVAGTDTINFEIPGTGVRTITVGSALPIITGPVVIDGSSQSGFTSTPLIFVTTSLTTGINGLQLNASNSTIENLAIGNFNGSGIAIGSNQTGNKVEGCFIGTNAAGTAAAPNNTGILLSSVGHTIGGVGTGQGNLISGNTGRGVSDVGDGSVTTIGNTILGNTIGLNLGRSVEVPNGEGIVISGRFKTVVGSLAGGNVIAGNTGEGISVVGNFDTTTPDGIVIQGNQIGGNAANDFGNGGDGVHLGGRGCSVLSNTIVGNSGNGINLFLATQNIIQQNTIGLTGRGNDGAGVFLNNGAKNNVIGGTAADTNPGPEGNLITANGGGGVNVFSNSNGDATGNTIRGNTIDLNTGLGIDLRKTIPVAETEAANTPTANDLNDTDTGNNNLQNFPVITGVNGTTVNFTFNSTPNTNFVLDFYSNDVPDNSNHGEGETSIGSLRITTNASGNSPVTSFTATAAPTPFVTATATNVTTGDTSEFSRAFPPSSGPTLVVDNLTDNAALSACTTAPADCSLRGAITKANAQTGTDSITFLTGLNGTITLGGTQLPVINGDTTIQGPGATTIQVNGNSLSRVFEIAASRTVSISGLTIRNGSAFGTDFPAQAGGGILNAGTLTLTSIVLSNNATNDTNSTVSDGGGGLYNNGGTVTIRNSTISGNAADINGAGIYSNGGGVTVDTVVFSNNAAGSSGGGGLFNTNGTCTVLDSTFTTNSGSSGGGILNQKGFVTGAPTPALTVLRTTFTGNAAEGFGGGGISNDRGTATVIDCTFANNTAGFGGGGVENDEGTMTVLGCTFNTNAVTTFDGGGIENSGGSSTTPATLTVENSTFTGNTANTGGGAIENLNSNLTVRKCTLQGNRADSGGGFENRGTGTILIESSTISNNTATIFGGGGIDNDGPNLTVRNCTLSGNSVPFDGGGLENRSGSTIIESSTIVLNRANSDGDANGGGGGLALRNGTLRLQNSIVALNVRGTGAGTPDDFAITAGGTGVLTSNGSNLLGEDSENLFNATGDQKGTPTTPLNPRLNALANNGGPTQTHLPQTGSPAINTGNTTLTVDQRGTARPQGAADDKGSVEVSSGPALPTLSVNNVATTEGDSGTKNLNFTVTLSAASTQNVSFNYLTQNGSATAPADYIAIPITTRTIPAGQTTATITVQVVGDTVVEAASETFFLNIGAPVNATIGDSDGVGRIDDDDTSASPCTAPGLVAWYRAEGNAQDSAGNHDGALQNGAVFTPGLSGRAFKLDGVNDYIQVPHSAALDPTTEASLAAWVFFNQTPTEAGRTMAIITKSGFGRDLDLQAFNDKFTFHVAQGGGAINVGSTTRIQKNRWYHVVGTYKANDRIEIYVNGVKENTLPIPGVTRQVNGNPLTIGENFTFPGRLFNGLIDEAQLYNRLLSTTEVRSIYNSGLSGGCQIPLDGLSINDVTITEGNSSTTNATFTVRLAPASTSTVSVRFTTSNGSATTPADYGAVSGTLTFAPGQTSKTISVPVVADGLVEPSETFFITLFAPTNATLVDNQGRGTIVNDDSTGGTCSAPPTGLVAWYRAEGNANDSAGNNNGTLQNGATFAAGQVGQAFRLDGVDDRVRVPASSSLDVGQSGGLTIEGWIKPSDVSRRRPVIEWNTGGFGVHIWISEPFGGGSPGNLYANIVDTSGNFHIIRSAGGLISAGNVYHIALTYDKASGAAQLFIDGVSVAAQNLGTFTPQTNLDLLLGGGVTRNENPGTLFTFAGLLDEFSIYNRALSAAQIAAIDNAGSNGKCPPLPTVSVNDVTITEGNSGTTNATFTVTLSPAATGNVTVNFATANGTTNPATAGSDYTGANGTLTFTPGQISKTIVVPIIGDTIVEADETFFVNLSSVSTNATIAKARGIGTITNDDLATGGDALLAWGYNDYGSVGDNTTIDRPSPVTVNLIRGARLIASGGSHNLAVAGNVLYAWGDNESGQLGDGTRTTRLEPVVVTLPTGIRADGLKALACGWYHSLAITADDRVLAWGLNQDGQCGVAPDAPRFVTAPRVIAGLTNITQVSGGTYHSLALDSSKRVWAWGNNFYGQLGNGTIENVKSVPAIVTNLPAVQAIGAGGGHSVALLSDGTARAWGWNLYGQLGDGLSGYTNDGQERRLALPVVVKNVSGGTQLSVGYVHNLMRKSDGTLLSWGNNFYGQLGRSTAQANAPLAAPVVVGSAVFNNVQSLAAGTGHNLVIRSDGTIWSWGYNEFGSLGLGMLGSGQSVPQRVPNLNTARAVAAGYGHSLVIARRTTTGTLVAQTPTEFKTGTSWASSNSITLTFSAKLKSIAPGGVRVLVNDQEVTVQSTGVSGTTLNVLLPNSTLQKGDEIIVAWSGLQTASGEILQGNSPTIIAE